MKFYNPWTWFPFTQDGRQTLVYLALAGCGPALLGAMLATGYTALDVIQNWPDAGADKRLDAYALLAGQIIAFLGWGLTTIVLALACFVSIRAINFNLKNGTASVQGRDNDATSAANQVADAAVDEATKIAEKSE